MKELSDKERTLRDRRTRTLFICFLGVPGRPNKLISAWTIPRLPWFALENGGKIAEKLQVLFIGLGSMTLVWPKNRSGDGITELIRLKKASTAGIYNNKLGKKKDYNHSSLL